MREVFADPAAANCRAQRGQSELRASHSREAVGRAACRAPDADRALPEGDRRARPGRSVSGELGRAGARIRTGPSLPGQSRFGGLQRPLDELVLRLMKPFTVHQRMIDEELVRSIAAISDGLAGAHVRLDQLGGADSARTAPRTSSSRSTSCASTPAGRSASSTPSGSPGASCPSSRSCPTGRSPGRPRRRGARTTSRPTASSSSARSTTPASSTASVVRSPCPPSTGSATTSGWSNSRGCSHATCRARCSTPAPP